VHIPPLLSRPGFYCPGAEMLAVSGADFSEALAKHVQPGTTLANFAMVCRAWAAAARALPIYYTPWDAEMQWAPQAKKWPGYLSGALEWQLAVYLRRLPQLEPDLQVPVLMDPEYVCVDYEVVPRATIDQQPSIRNGGSGILKMDHRHPSGPHLSWDAIILSIPEAAYRRVARRSSVHRFSSVLYDAARGALRTFLEKILRDALSYFQHRYGTIITAPDVVYALQLNGRYCTNSVPAGICGFFNCKQKDIEEDDPAQPSPSKEVLAYICNFGRLITVLLQDFRSAVPVSKAADVVLRRAAEDFLAKVFEVANESTALETLTPTLQSAAFVASTRVIINGMNLHRCSARPPGWVLDDESIATWSTINAEGDDGTTRRMEENIHGVHDDSDEDEDADFICTEDIDSDDMDDDEHEAFCQANDDYDDGYIFATDGDGDDKWMIDQGAWEAGRVDGVASRMHAHKRRGKEKGLEDMCTGFSAAPSAVVRAKTYNCWHDSDSEDDSG
jgi:histone H3/H4